MTDDDPVQSPEGRVRDEVRLFLRQNFPQIRMHGGEATITEVDLDENRVSINLSDACSGCGLSPMTITAIKQRLPQDIERIDSVAVSTGFEEYGTTADGAESSDRDVPDAPF